MTNAHTHANNVGWQLQKQNKIKSQQDNRKITKLTANLQNCKTHKPQLPKWSYASVTEWEPLNLASFSEFASCCISCFLRASTVNLASLISVFAVWIVLFRVAQNCQHQRTYLAIYYRFLSFFWNTHTHSVLTAIFPGEPGLAGCPLNSPSQFIPGLRVLLGQT